METLRFLFTTTFYPPYHIGGDAVHVKYLAEELSNAGHEVHVLHSIDAYRLKRKNNPKETAKSYVNAHAIKTPFKSSSYLAYSFGGSNIVKRKFKSLVNEIKPDVVHHHNISLLGYKILKKQEKYINLYTAHDYWLACQKNNLLKNGSHICHKNSCITCSLKSLKLPQMWRHFSGFKRAINEIDRIIAPSEYLNNRITIKGIPKVVTIPNFVPSPPSQIKASGCSNFFLYAGVLEKHKGILNLIKAYIDSKTKSQLLIVGMGSLKQKIKEFTKKFHLEDKILMKGWVDNGVLFSLLKDSNALILPSIWPENSPLIVLEALSVGTPVIASNNGGIPEIIGKVDKKLLFDDFKKLRNTLSSFCKGDFPSSMITDVYERNYSSEAYMRKYFETISDAKSK